MKLRTSLLQSKKSIGKFLVISYLIVFISLVIGLLAGYIAAYNALRQQEVITQEQTLMRVRGTVDAYLSKVLGQMSVYALSRSTKDYAVFNEEATVERARAMAATRQNVDVISSLLSLDAKLYAYFFNSKVLVTADGVVKEGGLAYYLPDTLDMSEEEFFGIINLSNIKYRGVTSVDEHTDNCRVVIAQSIIGNQRRLIEGVVFVVIPYSSLAGAMRIDVIPDGAELFISDGQQALNGIEVNSKDSIYSQLPSEYLPYYYQYIVSNHILRTRLSGSAFVLQGILAASLMFGITVTMWIMWTRLKLFRRLMRVFVPERDEARHITIEQIEKRLRQITQENIRASRGIEDQLFLRALDSGHEVDTSVPVQPGREGYDLILLYDSTLDDGGDAPLYTEPEIRELAMSRAYELASVFAGKNYGCVIRDDSILLILLPADAEEAFTRQAGTELITILREEIRPRFFGCSIRVAGGKDLPYGFSHVLNTLFFYSFWSLDMNELFISASPVSFESADLENSRSRWLGNRAYRCIAIGAYAEAYDLLLQEISERFQRMLCAASNNVSLLHGMSAMIVNTLFYRAPLTDRECIQSLKPDERLLKCNTLASFMCELQQVFNPLIQYEKNKVSRAPKWFERLQVFLEENYRNPNLSVAMATDELGISASYASEEFRKYAGVGIPDTIHMLRIAEAKVLFACGTSVKTAAEHLGYVDSRSLIRAFKKYEGMTPGQYIAEIVKDDKGVDNK